MSTLQERLDRIKTGFRQQAPAEVLAIMDGALASLRASGIMEKVARPGSALPAFALPDTDDKVVRSVDLLARGPLVVTYYRGQW